MTLFGMSGNNKLYFFLDRFSDTYWVFKLVNSTKNREGDKDIFGEKKLAFLKKDDLNVSSSKRQNYTDIYDLVA